MKVYVVINESLYDNSSYYDVNIITTDKKRARVFIETSVKDILANNLLGQDNVEVFYDADIEKQGFNNCQGALVLNTDTNYYEHFRLEEREVD